MATAPDIEGMPDEIKPLTYPFEYMWDKTQELKAMEKAEKEKKIDVECVIAAAN